MKLIHVASWKEASQKTGTYQCDAVNIEQAKDTIKKNHPGVEPVECYWHEVTDKVNRYYFVRKQS